LKTEFGNSNRIPNTDTHVDLSPLTWISRACGGLLQMPRPRSFRKTAELIGAEEMQRIIAHGEDEETTAIMLNPSVSDKVASLFALRPPGTLQL
jgi:hypothetical protein